MAGSRHNLFSINFCDEIAQNLKYPGLFVYLFYGFVTGWFLEILYLLIRAVLGSSQSTQTITALTPVPAQQTPHPRDQELKQDTSVTVLAPLPHRGCVSWEWPPGVVTLAREVFEHCLAWNITSCKERDQAENLAPALEVGCYSFCSMSMFRMLLLFS